jgi:hypothetical protein
MDVKAASVLLRLNSASDSTIHPLVDGGLHPFILAGNVDKLHDFVGLVVAKPEPLAITQTDSWFKYTWRVARQRTIGLLYIAC